MTAPASDPPVKHEWFQPSREQAGYPWTICRVCGVVQRRDGKNKPCKGPTKLREPEKYV